MRALQARGTAWAKVKPTQSPLECMFQTFPRNFPNPWPAGFLNFGPKVKAVSYTELFPLSNPGLATKGNLSLLDKDNTYLPFLFTYPPLPMGEEDERKGLGRKEKCRNQTSHMQGVLTPTTRQPSLLLPTHQQPHLTDGEKEAPRVKGACSRVTQPESGEGDSTQAF